MRRIFNKVVIADFYPKEHKGMHYWTGKLNGAPLYLFQSDDGVISACLQNEITERVFDKNNFVMDNTRATDGVDSMVEGQGNENY